MTDDAITLTMPRATADDLFTRLLVHNMQDAPTHVCYLLVLLAAALGEHVSESTRRRAELFA